MTAMTWAEGYRAGLRTAAQMLLEQAAWVRQRGGFPRRTMGDKDSAWDMFGEQAAAYEGFAEKLRREADDGS